MIRTQFNLTRRQVLAGLSATTALSLTGCKMVGDDGPVTSLSPDDWLEQVGYNLLRHEPERATSLGVDVGQFADLRGKLEDQSQAGQDALAATLRRDLEMTKSYPRDDLSPEQLTSFEAVESGYQVALDGLALPYGDIPVGSWRTAPYVVIQNVGSYLDLPRFMDSSHPIADEDDADFYLERMKQMPAVFDGELERMTAAADMGVVPPGFLIDKAIAQMESTIATAERAELFTSSLSERSAEAELKNPPVEEAAKVESEQVVAALKRQLEELKRQRALATKDPGMRERPQGEEWYDWALRSSTTTNMTADEIHNQGLEELEELHGQMDPILREIGFTKGTVGERMQGLSQDPRYKFAEGDPGRAEIMAFIKDRIEWIKGEMPRAFNTLVDPNLEVRRLPLSEEPGAPGAYGGAGSKDGTIPGRMWINLRTTDLHRKYDLADLTYHETIPGHVWEGEYSNRLPLIRLILAFNPFSEGWALYAEQLADELGAYDDFKVGRLGYLQSLAFRACRMVVDTGLHSKGWSRERAVNFFVERNGSKEQEVASEVDRYCSWPGQATGYKLGHSRIADLRAKAQSELGETYDLKAFNDAVILGGNVPMDVLAKNVSRYIDAAKG
ncbi:twin-arginine translocation pathway signal [Erythrobacter longus]|uniref:Twin-arginine translocation pathway signal n=1 Tax=Erythrobacter longus TaxID=1044 RepID=A0A074M3F0_ERYLO|nr:DUF885 domain-containing protein [Erythrobacter longus]KEO89101.1 twin-arginine translocation pathway signal [Erythrobacter longus]